jgi:hypothetical protein
MADLLKKFIDTYFNGELGTIVIRGINRENDFLQSCNYIIDPRELGLVLVKEFNREIFSLLDFDKKLEPIMQLLRVVVSDEFFKILVESVIGNREEQIRLLMSTGYFEMIF